MSTLVNEPVRITESADRSPTVGTIRVQHWDKSARTRRATKFWVFAWLGAAVAVILPLVHFFLVPALLIAGPVGFWWTLGQGSVVLGGEGTCPKCAAVLPIARGPYRFPLTDLCTNCQAQLTIEPVPP